MRDTHNRDRFFTWANVIICLLCIELNLACGLTKDPPPPPPGLTVTQLVPRTGPTESAVNVSIFGSGFEPGATVTIGDVAVEVTVVNKTRMTGIAPPHAAGLVDVVVTNPDGNKRTLVGGYSYTPVAIDAVSPNAGLVEDVVRISGTGFLQGATVTVDGVAASAIVFTPAMIEMIVPPHAAGPVDVVVTNPGGQSGTQHGGFTYQLVTISATPGAVASGGDLTVSWTSTGRKGKGDWVGLFKVGDPNVNFGWWAYIDDVPSGTQTTTAPAQPGQYEFRYLVSDLYTDAARSNAVTVTADYFVELCVSVEPRPLRW